MSVLDTIDRDPARAWLGCVALPVFVLFVALSGVACFEWLTGPTWHERRIEHGR